MSVDDDGEGVPEEELADSFPTRSIASRQRGIDTAVAQGLGLAITENAIRQHSGTISANRSHLGGLQVRFTLPLASA